MHACVRACVRAKEAPGEWIQTLCASGFPMLPTVVLEVSRRVLKLRQPSRDLGVPLITEISFGSDQTSPQSYY